MNFLKKLVPKLPNPKFRMRQGAMNSLINLEISPMNEPKIVINGLFGIKDKTYSKKKPMKTYSLNAISDETTNYFKRLWRVKK